MIFLDTSYLIAVLDPADQLHSRAVAWSLVVKERLLLTEYVLWECVNYFSMPRDRPKAHAAVSQIQSDTTAELAPASPDLFSQGIELHSQRPDKHWSLTDCISFIVMQRHKVTKALTFDHNFEEAGYESLLRRDPEL